MKKEQIKEKLKIYLDKNDFNIPTFEDMVSFAQEIATELEKENTELKEENKKLKEGLAIDSTFNKALNSLNKTLEEESDKYRNMVFDKDDQLTKAKELLNEFMRISKASDEDFEHDYSELIGEAEQFLNSEVKR